MNQIDTATPRDSLTTVKSLPREPGWYRDPARPRHHRYWEGDAWRADDSVAADGALPSPRLRA